MNQESLTTITSISTQSTTAEPYSFMGIGIAIIIMVIIFYIASIAFSWSAYKLLKIIDKDKQISPPWFAWLFLIPIVGYIFQWIVLPFGIGNALKKYEDMTIKLRGDTIFILGLTLVILPIASFIPVISPFASVACMVIYIIYWVKIVKARKLLENKTNNAQDLG